MSTRGREREWSRLGSVLVVLALTSIHAHGCTYVACAGLAGGVLVVSVCIPSIAAVISAIAVWMTARHHAHRTPSSRTAALLASVSALLGSTALGVLAAAATARPTTLPDALSAVLADTTVLLGLGAAAWLTLGVICLAVTLRTPVTSRASTPR